MSDELTLHEGLAAQAAEAEVQEQAKLNTKMVLWRDRSWMIRSKPSARFLEAYEQDKIMAAIKAVIGDKQYSDLIDMDPDVEGDEGMEGFIAACNRAWGVGSGN